MIRERFQNSDTTNKKPQEKKFDSLVNKTGARFRSKLAKLSVGKTWLEIEEEWIILRQVQLSKQGEQCLCGKANLKFITYLKNIHNKKLIIAGNCCLLTFRKFRL
ncbi:unnamed protein product [Adineta ricciae]|uniref:Uncharacterized protein n=1 Tax=Adineta ricciae TaxID=249248 RepID=A0A815PMT7_ADIRI|nr:unnamed protein product [Adineta ricciae]